MLTFFAMPRILACLGLALATIMAPGCNTPKAPGPEPSAPSSVYLNVGQDAAFVGSEACASCHEELYASYQSHGMAQSLYPLTAERVVEDFSGAVEIVDEQGDFRYTVYERDGTYWQEEYRLDERGQKTHQLARELEYVVGSGSAARTYLTEEDGRYYELPLTWYTQPDEGRGRWDFSPGYDAVNSRFDRLIPDRCMACHNGVSDPVAFVPGKYTEIAEGIGCEQCHGPGALHVEARLADLEPTDSIDYTIVNPAHLALDLRLDVCQQCHLSGSVSLLREGESAFGYRASEPLAARVALFDLNADEPGTISVISHADRMRMSACFLESPTMDCTTCHNPHEGFREQGPSYFNSTCLDCHAPAPLQAAMPTAELELQHKADANCFACHMPKVEADDAPHSSFTDHYIRVVRAEDRIVRQAEAAEGDVELEPYFERDDEDGIYQGMALVAYGRQHQRRDVLERGVTMLKSALADTPDHSEAQFLLGFALLQLGQPQAALPALRASLTEEVPERLNALAQAHEATSGSPAEIERLYRRALEIQPALADVRVNLGRFLETQGRVSEAVQQYRAAAEEQPWLATAHYNLGTALLRLGADANEAVLHLEEAITLQPDYPDALVNLGVVRASAGDTEAAGDLFRRAVEAGPESANAHSNLGTFYLQQGDVGRARDVLARAAALDPRSADVAANLAVAHLQSNQTAEARRWAEQALALNPAQATARQVLAALP